MKKVDVLICGGGPVGLLMGYCLARYGISTCIVEQHDRAKQIMYGRAAMIAPRTLEMLDQLDLTDALLQIGFASRSQVLASSTLQDTFYDFLLLVRQKYIEGIFHDGYRKYAETSVHYGTSLAAFRVNDQAGEYKVHADLSTSNGSHRTIASKYLIGADGGRSAVREKSGISFEREKTSRHFIRMDGIVRTNMPDARAGNRNLESASHGSVLWACLDHGRTRIGFAFPKKLWEEKGAKLTQDDVVQEAKKAVEPFSLEFESVEWWTAYSVGQGLAADYRAHGRIILAGDAAHTHSSAGAQGLNIGLHDAINLSWKLAGFIKGWYADSVLESYISERRFHASKIVEQDKTIALMTAGEVPEQFRDDPEFNVEKTLSDMYKRNQSLNSGLGVQYPTDGTMLVDFPGLNVTAGQRAPDALLQKPAMRLVPVRLYSFIKNVGKFTIVVFSGQPEQTASSLANLHEFVDGPQSWERYSADLFQTVTIMQVHNEFSSAEEKLGIPLFGHALYDVDGSCHRRYGVDYTKGAVIALRPDGTIGTAASLNGALKISEYFASFLKVGKTMKAPQIDDVQEGWKTGEVDIEAPGLQDWTGVDGA